MTECVFLFLKLRALLNNLDWMSFNVSSTSLTIEFIGTEDLVKLSLLANSIVLFSKSLGPIDILIGVFVGIVNGTFIYGAYLNTLNFFNK